MNYELYADDSHNDEFYTVAGYVVPAAVRATLKSDWFRVLKERPRLGFYRTNDALGLKGPFEGWSEDARNSRMAKLASVIPPTASYGVAAHLSRRDFEEFFTPNFLEVYHDPYYLCAMHLIQRTCLAFHSKASRMDFIFDRQGKVGQNFKTVFDSMWKPSLVH